MSEMALKVVTGKEAGGRSEAGGRGGQPWVCFVQTLLTQERPWGLPRALPAENVTELLS